MIADDVKKPDDPEAAARKRKLIITIGGWASGVLILIGSIWYAALAGRFATYTENKYQISIKYPRDWQVAPGYAGTVVTFASPKEDGLDTFQENLNIAVTDMSERPRTLDEYTQLAIKQMAAVFKTNIDVTESKPITFAGQPAYKYVAKSNPEDLILTVIWFIKDNQAYTITYIGQSIRYEKYRGLFEEMVRSFSIPTL